MSCFFRFHHFRVALVVAAFALVAASSPAQDKHPKPYYISDAGNASTGLPQPGETAGLILSKGIANHLAQHTGSGTIITIAPAPQPDGSFDKTIKVWDAQTGSELKILTGHTDGVLSVTISPDGKLIIANQFSGNNIISVNLEFKNTPHEKAHREFKASPKSDWHVRQAELAERNENWYAATFHRTWALKANPDTKFGPLLLQLTYEKLKTESTEKDKEYLPYLLPFVREQLGDVESLVNSDLSWHFHDLIRSQGKIPYVLDEHRLTFLLVETEREKERLEHLRRMFGLFDSNRASPQIMRLLVHSVCTAPVEDQKLVDRALVLAQTVADREPDNSWTPLLLGMAQLRAGQYPAAVKNLERAESILTRSSYSRSMIFSCRAMAEFQQGHQDTALKALTSARESLPKLPTLDGKTDLGSSWHDILSAKALLEEAESMLKMQSQ
ncbi:MAG: hypothetical protein COA78_14110 [Blastopirellula sp.]|nr:MAG: hypothetical protein COA78_14110 [Blastopirellula sp.]